MLNLILIPNQKVAKQYGDELGIDIKLLQGGQLGSKIANPPKKKNVDIIISTVHVIKEMSRAKMYSLTEVKTVVLDEADTLLDDSFSMYVDDLLNKFAVS